MKSPSLGNRIVIQLSDLFVCSPIYASLFIITQIMIRIKIYSSKIVNYLNHPMNKLVPFKIMSVLGKQSPVFVGQLGRYID